MAQGQESRNGARLAFAMNDHRFVEMTLEEFEIGKHVVDIGIVWLSPAARSPSSETSGGDPCWALAAAMAPNGGFSCTMCWPFGREHQRRETIAVHNREFRHVPVGLIGCRVHGFSVQHSHDLGAFRYLAQRAAELTILLIVNAPILFQQGCVPAQVPPAAGQAATAASQRPRSSSIEANQDCAETRPAGRKVHAPAAQRPFRGCQRENGQHDHRDLHRRMNPQLAIQQAGQHKNREPRRSADRRVGRNRIGSPLRTDRRSCRRNRRGFRRWPRLRA